MYSSIQIGVLFLQMLEDIPPVEEDQVVPQIQEQQAQSQGVTAPRGGKGRMIRPSTSQVPEVRVTHHEIPRQQDQGVVQAPPGFPQQLQESQVTSSTENRPWTAGQVETYVFI